jgi:hypothetical protein
MNAISAAFGMIHACRMRAHRDIDKMRVRSGDEQERQ